MGCWGVNMEIFIKHIVVMLLSWIISCLTPWQLCRHSPLSIAIPFKAIEYSRTYCMMSGCMWSSLLFLSLSVLFSWTLHHTQIDVKCCHYIWLFQLALWFFIGRRRTITMFERLCYMNQCSMKQYRSFPYTGYHIIQLFLMTCKFIDLLIKMFHVF